MTVSVVVAEDAAVLREGLVRVLEASGLEVSAAVGTYDDLLAAVRRCRPDVVLTDLRMPPSGTDEGLRAAETLRQSGDVPAVLVFSSYTEPECAQRLLELGPGVGYLVKERVADVAALREAVERVAAGGTVVDPEVVAPLLRRRRTVDPLEALTPREREVLALMAEGMSNDQVCRALVLSPKTVERHIASLLGKLGLDAGVEGHRRVRAVLLHLRAAAG